MLCANYFKRATFRLYISIKLFYPDADTDNYKYKQKYKSLLKNVYVDDTVKIKKF